MTNEIQFTVPGTPVGKGRPRFSTVSGQALAYTPIKTKEYERLIKQYASRAMNGRYPFERGTPLSVIIMAFFPIPKSYSKARREACATNKEYPTKKPDCDNIEKIVCDAMNDTVFWTKVYTRFSTLEQREYLLRNFKEIVEKHCVDGIQVRMSEPTGFLPFLPNEENQALFRLVQKAGSVFGLQLEGFRVRGAADAGITSCAGVPTICGMGIVGDHLHTEREFAVKASLVERLKVVLMSILMADKAF